MAELELETLLTLLETYEAALVELRRLDDPHVFGLIHRLERRQSDVIAAIADKNSQALASLRAAAAIA